LSFGKVILIGSQIFLQNEERVEIGCCIVLLCFQGNSIHFVMQEVVSISSSAIMNLDSGWSLDNAGQAGSVDAGVSSSFDDSAGADVGSEESVATCSGFTGPFITASDLDFSESIL
jgi:hypothetical protein